jgi:hypothetical protein
LRLWIWLCALLLILVASPLPGQEPEPSEAPQEAAASAESTAPPSAGATEETREESQAESQQSQDSQAESQAESLSKEEGYKQCIPPKGNRQAWIDWFQRQLHRSACASALWFDGFFGDQRYTSEIDETHGQVALRTFYDEFEGMDVSLRARIHVVFPNLDRRLSAFVGRGDEKEEIEDRREGLPGPPLFLEEFEEQEWLVGLGYRPLSGKRRRLSFSGGVKLRFPLEPYAKARYRRRFFFGDRTLLHMRDTVFWTSQRGFGNTLGLELSHVLNDNILVRSSNFATIAEDTDGVDWKTVLTLYHDLSNGDRAIAYEVGWEGETSAPVTVDEIGFRVTYRQRLHRDWLFGELVTGVNWPRELPEQPRTSSFLVGIGAEIRFGRQP